MQKLLKFVASIGWASLAMAGLLLLVLVVIMVVSPPR